MKMGALRDEGDLDVDYHLVPKVSPLAHLLSAPMYFNVYRLFLDTLVEFTRTHQLSSPFDL